VASRKVVAVGIDGCQERLEKRRIGVYSIVGKMRKNSGEDMAWEEGRKGGIQSREKEV